MKRILITGAGSGIGLATASLLTSKGYSVAATCRNDASRERITHACSGDVHISILDVRDYEAVKNWMSGIGQFDVLINNAGLGYFDSVADGKIEHWHEMVDVNVKGLLNCIHAGLPALIEKRGHIINIGSVASRNVFANSGIYASTKHAVLAISESLRIEMAGKIRVSTIMPGATNTDFIHKTDNQNLLKDYVPYFAAGLDSATIAEAILYCIEAPEGAVISEITVRPDRKII